MALLERPKNWRDLAAGFVLNNLSDEEMMLWKALCAQDPELEKEVSHIQQTFNQFADVIPLHVPPQHLINELKVNTQHQLGAMGDNSQSSGSQDRQKSIRSSKWSLSHFSLWQRVGAIIGVGAIGWFSIHVYGLQQQIQRLTDQLIIQQQLLQTTNAQMADIHQQLDQTTSQLASVEESLAQSKEREESMQQLLQKLTKESPGISTP